MTLMRIRELISCPDHRTTIVVLEDAGQRPRLAMHTDPHEGQRLAREMERAPCTGNPVYDFIQSLLDSFQAAVSRVMLDDVQGEGIGGVIYLRYGRGAGPRGRYQPLRTIQSGPRRSGSGLSA